MHVSYFQINPGNVTQSGEKRKKNLWENMIKISTQKVITSSIILDLLQWYTEVLNSLVVLRDQSYRLVMNWLRANEKGFSSYKSCILTCFACFKNMNFGGSSDLFKKLGPKFEDEGLFYSFQYKFFSRIQDNEMLTQSECF